MVPARLQKGRPHCLQRNRRAGVPSLVGYVPLETMLPLPVFPYKEQSGFGQASFLSRYFRRRPLLAILFLSSWKNRIPQEELFINH